jgi:hypothetical protein
MKTATKMCVQLSINLYVVDEISTLDCISCLAEFKTAFSHDCVFLDYSLFGTVMCCSVTKLFVLHSVKSK